MGQRRIGSNTPFERVLDFVAEVAGFRQKDEMVGIFGEFCDQDEALAPEV